MKLGAEALVAVAAAEPCGKAVSQAKPSRRQTLFVGGADGAIVLDVGSVRLSSERSDEGVEDVGGKSDERWQTRVGVGEGDLEAQDGRRIGAWRRKQGQLANGHHFW